jgi:hypothetical protein
MNSYYYIFQNLILTLVNTARYDIAEIISLHIPISDALNGIGRLYFDKNFHASKRSSIKLLIKANNGAKLKFISQISIYINQFYIRKSRNK